ncbi:MAG: hypothetical protein GY874_07215 [Desulfobacteraceae bacterium]|nr:hypothetical protein [Desulfobacteraceae bacterium]
MHHKSGKPEQALLEYEKAASLKMNCELEIEILRNRLSDHQSKNQYCA